MRRKVIAITGGIGSGKSSVSKILVERGFEVVDCDAISRVMATDQAILQQVADLLGPQSVVNGKLNRPYVRSIVFANDKLYEKYSQIFWDGVKQALLHRVEKSSKSLFVEIPVINAFEFAWDEIWLVDSCVDVRVARVCARDGVSPASAMEIVSRQKLCDNYTRIIENNGTFAQLQAKVDDVLQKSIFE